ncbi:hypothetical protein RchiOBHm_MTg0498671 (mitochondrion) [Rosa chinensis]|uniref:Uncharacterized protein n=1 Tax=Rosa chinensis TaxID=74649 RepID=A0A2P6P126_ROSCH|nr:hypothetical protein RchiOBHm_MTg0498671 [Rosa chinensis]
MGPLTSSYALCGSHEANEGKLEELTGEAARSEFFQNLEFLFTNELGKPTERFDSDFVEPVLLLPARRAVPHSRPGALRGFCF